MVAMRRNSHHSTYSKKKELFDRRVAQSALKNTVKEMESYFFPKHYKQR